MKLKTTLAAIPLMLGLAFAASEASAAACFANRTGTAASGAEQDVGAQTGDVTFEGVDANDCSAAYQGNLTPEQEEELANQIFGPGFEHIVKTEGGSESGTLDDLTLTVSQDNPGEWELEISGLDAGETITLDFIALFKQSQGLGLWLFEDVQFSDTDNNGTGTFVIRWCSGNPQDPLEGGCEQTTTSHLSILAGAPDTPTENPEPATLLLFGIGLAGLALTQRRRRRSI